MLEILKFINEHDNGYTTFQFEVVGDLLTNEECANAIDMGDFYRVPCDKRDLNYDKYFRLYEKISLLSKSTPPPCRYIILPKPQQSNAKPQKTVKKTRRFLLKTGLKK